MKKTRSAKRALLMSALSLLLCVSMLVGTTFAWFTDSVTSAGNIIQSGTLDVDLVDAQGNSMAGKVIEFVTADDRAQDKILWEPGCTYETKPVKVINKGNLALKYQIVISGITGDAKLLEAIEWTVYIGDPTKPENAVALADLKGELLAGATTEAIVLKGHMKEEAGNEYQNLSVENIAISVYATQLTHENDSFDNQYDKYASVATTADMKAALAEGITEFNFMGNEINLNYGLSKAMVPAGTTVTIANAVVSGKSYGNAADGTVIFENCTFTNTGAYSIHFDAGEGDVIFKNCKLYGWNSFGDTLNSVRFYDCALYGNGTYGLIRSYADLHVENCYIDTTNANHNDNYSEGVEAVSGATLTEKNNTYVATTLSEVMALAKKGNTTIDAKGANLGDYYYSGTFANGTVLKNAKFTYVYGASVDGLATFENCEFVSDHSYSANFSDGSYTGKVVFNNCSFDGWSSFGDAITAVEMNECTFKMDIGNYGILRFYQNAVLNNCEFASSFEGVDTNKNGTVVNLNNCTGIDGKIYNNGTVVGKWIVDGVELNNVTSW